jgi:PAS domain S-box-containing protein
VPIRGHDLPLTTVGVFILWVGWYGFNGGSTLALTSDVPSIILNTTIAAAFGGVVGLALTWRLDGRPDVAMIMNSALAGLVGITASANVMDPWQAAVIGAVAALVMRAAVYALERAKLDDAVGAVPVHLAAGIWGTLAVALLGDVNAFPTTSSRLEQAGIQLAGIGTCCVWAFGLTFLVLSLINRVVPFRVDPAGELAGLNIAEHGASTEIADLLVEMDEHRRSGDFARPVRVEPHTEVGQIAAEYNRVLKTIQRRTDSLQLAVAVEEVCAFTGWSVGHALLVSTDDPDLLVSAGVWSIRDHEWYAAFRAATEAERWRSGRSLPGLALRKGKPVFAASADEHGRPMSPSRLEVVGEDGRLESVVVPSPSSRGQKVAEWEALGRGSGLAIPVLAGSKAVGVLEFFSAEPIRADPELLELLLSVGTQLGRVVERQRSEEARLRGLIDNMPASVYLRDLEGRYILVNRGYEEFYGVRSDEIRGKTIQEAQALTEIDLEPATAVQADRDAFAAGEPRRRELVFVRNGYEHVIADVSFPVRDGTGRVVAIAGIDIDITTEKRHEAELAELLRRVEMARDTAMEAASAKTRFLANMSHELRTPLNAIIGFTRIVSRNARGLPERQVDNLSKILVSAEHLLGLIDEILDLSRIEAGQLAVEVERVDVVDVLGEVAESLEPLLDRDRPREAQADPPQPVQQRGQVHGRRNGRDARRSRRRTAPDQRCRHRARDLRGRGREDLRRVSPLRLHRLHDAPWNRPRALDLSPSRAGARRRAHGGEQARCRHDLHARPAARRGEAMRKRLLIVEDSELNRELLVQIFEDSYDLDVAVDGRTAVQAATTSRPDLILMDIDLPGMSGLDAVRAIRANERGAGTPIVAVSSHVMPGDRERALEAGCNEFVAKPIDDEALVALVRRLLEEQ